MQKESTRSAAPRRTAVAAPTRPPWADARAEGGGSGLPRAWAELSDGGRWRGPGGARREAGAHGAKRGAHGAKRGRRGRGRPRAEGGGGMGCAGGWVRTASTH
eukprot:6248563-Prymnesium_polylepis.1